MLDAFARLPLIVAIVEREERRAVGVTVEGVPIELVVAHPSRFGTELVRATGSPEYVASLGSLPDAARRRKPSSRLSGCRGARPSSARLPFAPSRRR